MARFDTTYINRKDEFELGLDSQTGSCYLAVLVGPGGWEFMQYHRLSDTQYHHFIAHPMDAFDFSNECRIGRHNDSVISDAQAKLGQTSALKTSLGELQAYNPNEDFKVEGLK